MNNLTPLVLALALGACAPLPPQPVPPPLTPPPAEGYPALSRDAALELARSCDLPSDAIAALDRHPFVFPLDAANLAWFGGQGLEPEVLDYLEKRAKVDWESLRGN